MKIWKLNDNEPEFPFTWIYLINKDINIKICILYILMSSTSDVSEIKEQKKYDSDWVAIKTFLEQLFWRVGKVLTQTITIWKYKNVSIKKRVKIDKPDSKCCVIKQDFYWICERAAELYLHVCHFQNKIAVRKSCVQQSSALQDNNGILDQDSDFKIIVAPNEFRK